MLGLKHSSPEAFPDWSGDGMTKAAAAARNSTLPVRQMWGYWEAQLQPGRGFSQYD